MREVGDEVAADRLEALQARDVDEDRHRGDLLRGQGKRAHFDGDAVAHREALHRLLPGERAIEGFEDGGDADDFVQWPAGGVGGVEQLREAAVHQHHAPGPVDGE